MAKSTKKKPDSTRVADATARLLADSYTLYLETHNFHWNATGPMFTTLHTLFETQYTRNSRWRWTRSPSASARPERSRRAPTTSSRGSRT